MTVPPALLAAFDTMFRYIDAARDIVAAGQTPDMLGMDKRVSDLCARIADAEPDVQQECLPKLGALLEKFDQCEADMQRARDALTTKGAEQ